MERNEIKALYYIVHIKNVISICRLGIYSHKLAKQIRHESIAMEEIQDRRTNKRVPKGKSLHEYANLYVNPRNAMMYYLKCNSDIENVCIIEIEPKVLDIPDVIITDRNAATDYPKYEDVKHGLKLLDKQTIFAKYWTHNDDFETIKHKQKMCAEVLVPNKVEPKYIMSVLVCSDKCKIKLKKIVNKNVLLKVDKYLFFED